MKKLSIILIAVLIYSCSSDDSQKVCLAGPSGKRDISMVNVSISTELTELSELSFDKERQVAINTDGLDLRTPALFTDWQAIPVANYNTVYLLFNTSLDLNPIQIEIAQPIVDAGDYIIEVHKVKTQNMVTYTAEIKLYSEDCIDTFDD